MNAFSMLFRLPCAPIPHQTVYSSVAHVWPRLPVCCTQIPACVNHVRSNNNDGWKPFKSPLILPSVERRKFSICVAVALSQVLGRGWGRVQKTLAIVTSPSVRCLVCMATCPLTKLTEGFVSGRSVFRIIYRLPASVQPARGGR